jgi:hypothetical protein
MEYWIGFGGIDDVDSGRVIMMHLIARTGAQLENSAVCTLHELVDVCILDRVG